jgi:ribonuclease HI
MSAPVLAHPDYTKPFILHTDASTMGLGVVLSQKDSASKEHPIAFLFRTFSPAEKNYTSTELECPAIMRGLRKLHSYLDGATFEIITDHSALRWIQTSQEPTKDCCEGLWISSRTKNTW